MSQQIPVLLNLMVDIASNSQLNSMAGVESQTNVPKKFQNPIQAVSELRSRFQNPRYLIGFNSFSGNNEKMSWPN